MGKREMEERQGPEEEPQTAVRRKNSRSMARSADPSEPKRPPPKLKGRSLLTPLEKMTSL